MSFQRSPSSSLRRMPVAARTQSGGTSRCPATAARNACSCWAVQVSGSTLGIDLSRGAWATRATFRLTSPPLLRLGERAADDEVDLEDGLGCEWPAPVGRAEHRLVQSVELFRSEPSDRDPPLGRE